MSLSSTEVTALKQFALGQTHAERFSLDASTQALLLRPRNWGERLVRLLWTLITFGREDGFANMRWAVVAQKIQEQASDLFRAVQGDAQRLQILRGLRSKLLACNASFRARHPTETQHEQVRCVLKKLDRWLCDSAAWKRLEFVSAR